MQNVLTKSISPKLTYALICGVFFAISFSACQSDTGSASASAETPAFQIQQVREEFQTGPCTGPESPCFRISLYYPEVTQGREPFKTAFNERIYQVMILYLQDFLVDQDSAVTLESLKNSLFAEFDDMLAGMEEETPSIFNWAIEVRSEILYQSDTRLSVSIYQYAFTGGAHPNSAIQYINFDPRTGDGINLEDIVKDVHGLSGVVESIFRTQYQVPEGTRFSDKGYWFEGDTFRLPQNFALTSTGFIFRYNPYEIGPYVMGAHEVAVPYEAVKSYLKLPE